MGRNVKHHGFPFVLTHSRKRRVEQLHVLRGRATVTHGMRQVIDLHGEWDGDDPIGTGRSAFEDL
jgi:hypothetical protein